MEWTTHVSFELNIFRFLVCGACEKSPESTNTENTNCAITEGRKNVHRKAERKKHRRQQQTSHDKLYPGCLYEYSHGTKTALVNLLIRQNAPLPFILLVCVTCMENGSLASHIFELYSFFFLHFLRTSNTLTKSESIKVSCMSHGLLSHELSVNA